MKKSPALFERDIRKLYSTLMEIYFDLANEWVSINETKKFQFLLTTLTPCTKNGNGNFARDKNFLNNNNMNKRS